PALPPVRARPAPGGCGAVGQGLRVAAGAADPPGLLSGADCDHHLAGPPRGVHGRRRPDLLRADPDLPAPRDLGRPASGLEPERGNRLLRAAPAVRSRDAPAPGARRTRT